VPRRTPAKGNPFASLNQEKTVETQVAGRLLDLAKGGAMGADTRVYHVPRELLERARRKKKVGAESHEGPAGASPRAQTFEARAPIGVCPLDASGHLAAWARSSLLPSAPGQLLLRILGRLQSRDSKAIARAALRGAIAAGPWLVLVYAAYRLILG
jgi:hypothetical protein